MMEHDKKFTSNYETIIEKREPPKKHKEYPKFKENECKKSQQESNTAT